MLRNKIIINVIQIKFSRCETNFSGGCRTKKKMCFDKQLTNKRDYLLNVRLSSFIKILCLSIKDSWFGYFERFRRKQYTSILVIWLINLLMHFDFNCIYLFTSNWRWPRCHVKKPLNCALPLLHKKCVHQQFLA